MNRPVSLPNSARFMLNVAITITSTQIGELRSGSPRLEELNHYLRHLHKDGHLDVLSFSEVCLSLRMDIGLSVLLRSVSNSGFSSYSSLNLFHVF